MNRNFQSSGSEQSAIRAAYASADATLDGSNDAPALGAHLITRRRGYEHHGIYVGGGNVVHYAGFAKSAHRGPVEEVRFEEFADGHAVAVRPHPFPKYSGAETALRALSRPRRRPLSPADEQLRALLRMVACSAKATANRFMRASRIRARACIRCCAS